MNVAGGDLVKIDGFGHGSHRAPPSATTRRAFGGVARVRVSHSAAPERPARTISTDVIDSPLVAEVAGSLAAIGNMATATFSYSRPFTAFTTSFLIVASCVCTSDFDV